MLSRNTLKLAMRSTIHTHIEKKIVQFSAKHLFANECDCNVSENSILNNSLGVSTICCIECWNVAFEITGKNAYHKTATGNR